jgi:hypothetical protein
MKLNSLVFPAPTCSYSTDMLKDELIYIPKPQENTSMFCKGPTTKHIPCLYLPAYNGSTKVMLYFHGNAEDLGLGYEMVNDIRNTLRVSQYYLIIDACN